MKNCSTCKFMNFRCKGNCGDCVNRVFESPSLQSRQPPLGKVAFMGSFYKEVAAEEKCKCTECYDEDSGKYKYWVGEPELMKYFEGVQE